MRGRCDSLKLRSRCAEHDLPISWESIERVRTDVFWDRGVILPIVAYERDDKLEAGRVELLIWGRPIPLDSFEERSLKQTLNAHCAEFVVPLLIEHYLEQLARSHPDLVFTTEATFGIDELTYLLRARVEAGESIRDFPGALEEMLQTHAAAVK